MNKNALIKKFVLITGLVLLSLVILTGCTTEETMEVKDFPYY